jgi:S1-C subfamily serine protease
MADKAYVWAPIQMGDAKDLKPGDEVTAADLPEGDFEQFLAEGVIRPVEFPEGVGVYESVRSRMNSDALAAFNTAVAVGTPEQADQPVNQEPAKTDDAKTDPTKTDTSSDKTTT